jgi:hypothetical protein
MLLVHLIGGGRKTLGLGQPENIEVGYQRRSVVETTFFRVKTIIGDKLTARTMRRHQTEAAIRCLAITA